MSALARARRLLRRPTSWIEQTGDVYVVRVANTRAARVVATVSEREFQALVQTPGLRARPSGGWMAKRETAAAPDQAGLPGRVEGDVWLMDLDGRVQRRRANLTRSAIRWLAGRRDEAGKPLLTRVQVAAAEILEREAERAASAPSLTLRWDAVPRTKSGAGMRFEPGDDALAAGKRVTRALAACGPDAGIVEAVVIRASALQAAEHGLGLTRRTGKAALSRGLTALAIHYGLIR